MATKSPSLTEGLSAVTQELVKRNIPVVEYGEALNRRFGYPAAIITWAVPDDSLWCVSNILRSHGFQPGGVLPIRARLYGKLETGGLMFQYTATRVHLIPLSFTRLSLDDCEEVAASFSPQYKALIPRKRPYLISLVRRLVELPPEIGRTPIQTDLLIFLDKVTFPRLPEGEDEEDESEEHFQERVEQALSRVRAWDWEAGEMKYLNVTERVIRDCRLVGEITECLMMTWHDS